jgi:hypothetical protein
MFRFLVLLGFACLIIVCALILEWTETRHDGPPEPPAGG